jgi:hypothetical protein
VRLSNPLRNILLYAAHLQPHYILGTRPNSSPELMASAKPYFICPAFTFVAYSNRESVPIRDGMIEAVMRVSGALRYPEFAEFVREVMALGCREGEGVGGSDAD